MKIFCLAVAILALSSCGADSPAAPATAAPTPTPTPAPLTANLVATGSSAWVSCLPAIGGFIGSCELQGTIQNTGKGCAGTIRGTTQFLAGGSVVGATAAWSFGSSVVMRPGETLVYLTSNETLPTVNATTGYITTPSWSNVACQ